MTEKYNIESFLITYDSNSGYILYTYDNDEYVVTLEAIGTRTVEPISEEESEISSNYYFRLLASLGTFYQSFYIDANSGEIIEDKRRVQLEGLETYVKAINADESFITYKDKAVDGDISVNNGIVYVEWPIDIIDESEEKINIQLSYISCIPLVVGQNYIVEFNGDTINPYHGVWECKERNGLLYLGDYNPFMEDSDDPTEPEPGIIVELQQVEDRENLFYSDIDYHIEYVEDLTTRYKININGDILGEISDTTPSKKIVIEDINYFYVGNLYLFTEEESDDTEENYLILSNTNNSQIYIATFEAETIELSIDVEVLTEIKALEGATLLSFGRDTPDEHNSLNNYGIAINSSDDFLALPQRAISLFETQIHPDESIKVDYRFRGILGTLPSMSSGVNASIYNHMQGTQGIYTDNMYIGDSSQYLAFYTDSQDLDDQNNPKKKLKIKANQIVFENPNSSTGWSDVSDVADPTQDGHFIYSEAVGNTPAGAGIIQSYNNNPALWGYNTWISTHGIALRHGENSYANLNAEGLVLNKGGIRSGEPNTNNFIYLSTNDYPLRESGYVLVDTSQYVSANPSEENWYELVNNEYQLTTDTIVVSNKDYYTYELIEEGVTINSYTPSKENNNAAWREIIGQNFGVDSEGNLYASNAHLSNASVEGAIVATSLTINTGINNYDGISAINISRYNIKIVNDSTGVSISDIDTKTYLYPHVYYDGIEIVNNLDYSLFTWYKDNNTVGQPGDQNNSGRILAEYGHTYRVIYNFIDGVVGDTIDLSAPLGDVSKYITRIDANGIQVHSETWDLNTSSYVQIDGHGFSIFDGVKQIAQYGEDAIIGDENEFHIKITANYEFYFLTNDTSVNVEKTYYIKNNDIFEEVLSPSGNPHENNYYEKRLEPRLSFYRDDKHEVAYISENKLYITQSVVLDQMDIGRLITDGGSGQWSWKVHEVSDKNNLYLKWLG